MSPDILIYLAVVAVLWIAYLARKHRRRARVERLGDADAYEGNLIIPPAGESRGRPTAHRPHGSHHGHGGGHPGHGSGHFGHEGGHAGHDAAGGHH